VELGVLLDLDGTLVVADGSWPAWLEALRAGLGVPRDRAADFDGRLRTALRAPGAVTLARACVRALAEASDAAAAAGAEAVPAARDVDVTAVTREAVARYAASVRLADGAAALLDELAASGVASAIVTNGPEDVQRAVIEAVGLVGRVGAAVVSGAADVAVRKPHPKIFWLACTALGVRPEDTLMLGDDLVADIRGAHRFGMSTCWFAPPGAVSGAAPAATVVVADLTQAVAVVRAFTSH
jgi:HAD superfamily hydrolase (TIGR01509 family)